MDGRSDGDGDVVSTAHRTSLRYRPWLLTFGASLCRDTSELPPPQNITNINGKILLGFLEDDDPSEHLDVDSPLAQGFNITSGSVQLTVPNVPAKDDYIIVCE